MELLKTGAAELGIHLSETQLGLFRRYYRELVEWNARINLTSVTGWEEVQARHFLDSLTVSLALPSGTLESGRFVDVGSGAGFPGVPLKIAFPGLRAMLIESTGKKVNFLLGLKDALGLCDLDVRIGRAETLAQDPGLREAFDFVVGRALADMAVLAELTLPFCRVGGVAIAQKKLNLDEELERARGAIDAMGGELREVKEVRVQQLGEPRCLVVMAKVRPTPDRYPRRSGMPKKRPL